MFVYTAPLNTNHDIEQAQNLWHACLSGLMARLPQTQIELWLSAIEPLSLSISSSAEPVKSDGKPPATLPLLGTLLLLTCQTAQTKKIDAIVSQFQTIIEQQCQQLCGCAVEWSLLNKHSTAKQIKSTPDHTLTLQTSEDDAFLETETQMSELLALALPCANSAFETPVKGQTDVNKGKGADHTTPSEHLDDENTDSLDDHANNIHSGTGLNQRLSFDRFVVGKANQMAHAAALHVADSPGQSYNPLFLYGGVGLGKTHLAHAVGNAVLINRPNARIRYIHANQFIADVVASYRRQTFDAFKRYYHGLDVLLIDDIQFFADKKRTQEELFYAFEALVSNHSQIILTSDTYPKDLADIESRLVSRFSAGLITAIDPPEYEMRVAILHEKAKTLAMLLEDDVAFFIAKNLRSNVRELEGALHKLLAYSRFQNSHITLEMAKVALRDVITGPRGVLSVEAIQKVVADYYKVKVSDLYGQRRLASIVLPRQVAMYLTKELTQKSLPDIGESFGGRDHTTVLHAVRKINAEKLKNPQLNHQVNVIQQTLEA